MRWVYIILPIYVILDISRPQYAPYDTLFIYLFFFSFHKNLNSSLKYVRTKFEVKNNFIKWLNAARSTILEKSNIAAVAMHGNGCRSMRKTVVKWIVHYVLIYTISPNMKFIEYFKKSPLGPLPPLNWPTFHFF